MSRRFTQVGSFASFTPDADAVSYLNAIGIPNDGTVYYPSTPQQITGAGIWTATNDLFVYLKENSIYSKLIAMYLYVGGTAASHKFNAINPLDTDAAFRLVFSGGNTHSATGWLPNGSNGFANSYINPRTHLIQNDLHISAYIRNSTTGILMGVDTTDSRLSMSPNLEGSIGYHNASNSGAGITSLSSNVGLWTISRKSSSNYKVYNRDSTFATIGITSDLSPNASIALGCRTGGSTNSFFSGAEQCTTTAGLGLTDSEVDLLEAGIQTFNTALFRNV
jgi:hypothetical protein